MKQLNLNLLVKTSWSVMMCPQDPPPPPPPDPPPPPEGDEKK